MVKYVKCISDSGIPFTEGNCYATVNTDKSSYLLTDDYGTLQWWNKTRFAEPYDLPEAITFASQQEFEDAVMKVVLERLAVQTLTFDKFGRKLTEQYSNSTVYDILEGNDETN